MAKPRMIQGQFGALTYSTGIVDPTITVPSAPTVVFNENFLDYQGVKRHNDQFFNYAGSGTPLDFGGLHFMTWDYVDLRDLVEEKSCMDDVVINVQRQYELPYPNDSFNIPPGNIEETFLVLLGDFNLEDGQFLVSGASRAGFMPLKGGGETSQGGLPFEVLYREVRQYVQDPSQNFLSPDQVGSRAGPLGDATAAPTRFCGNFRLSSRTIGGYPDLLVGPGLTIIRAWSVFPANRTFQSVDGGGPTDDPATELDQLQFQLQLKIPALQYNIVGTQRKLTATETATYYSNILMKS
jgi:hypothetical protein